MKIHEYSGKQLFREYGIPVPQSILFTQEVNESTPVFFPCVLKSQVLVGGRMKAGGVLFAEEPKEFAEKVALLLHREIKGEQPAGVLCEEKVSVVQEYYLSLMIDRSRREILLVFSEQGGIEIESYTGKILQGSFHMICKQLPDELREVACRLFQMMTERDLTLVEINPVARLADGRIMALDAVVDVDDNALWRQKWAQTTKSAEEVPFHFVNLGGDIGIIGCGAGIVMGTMDAVTDAGGKPADFLDLGGGAQKDVTLQALKLLQSMGLRRIVLNIFGGITKCDEIAKGLVHFKQDNQDIELFIKLKGTNDREGKQLLAGHQIPVYDEMYQMVEEAVRRMRQC